MYSKKEYESGNADHMLNSQIVIADEPCTIQVGGREKAKTTINLPRPLLDRLKKNADTTGVSVSEQVRRALELDSYLRAVLEGGGEILIQQEQGGTFARLHIEEG